MPRASPYIKVNSRVSVVPNFLKDTGFLDLVTGVDTNQRGCRFFGKIVAIYDEGSREKPRRVRQQQQQTVETVQQLGMDSVEDVDLLEDAIQDPMETGSEDESDDEVVLDLNWVEQDINVDVRESDPMNSFRLINPVIKLSGAAFASPATYFLHFLPCEHIKRVQSWISLDWPEYLTWIMLYIKMTIITCRDRKVYWQKGNCPYYLNFSFGEYMDMHRFDEITNWHVFCTPNGSVDISNNRRDNLTNFHDVMRSQRWELRCLASFLGVAEADAFSAFKYFTPEGEDVLHTTFRWRLAESLKRHIAELREGRRVDPMATRSSSTSETNHSLVPIGKTKSNKPIARQCTICKKKTQRRCS
ncbi:hypothetical protein BCR42DRAFT_390558 [Absidia repens]|uniref:PiggyBac transposable element-derived protein domain-containing protein n=1 Tax=Absidia repens TaxID=90262 RepID=A0A1X2IMH3_9FUNG|nr:hypothetical protein BCR42DRAFT_390558 [Absidia repens]